MDLKVGDLVVFKKYDDMTEGERCGINEKKFPEFGKVSKIYNSIGFMIEGKPYVFNKWSIDYVISGSDADDIHVGDEVLVKATVKEVYNTLLKMEPAIYKTDVINILKHKDERFVLQEGHYGMYITDSMSLSLDKSKAKIYNSCNEANEAANDMRLNDWEVIPYDD